MTENLKKFVEEASKNEELKEKLMKLDENSINQIIPIAKEYGFTKEECDNLRKAAQMHDIGKIGIPDSILNKPSRLTDEEDLKPESNQTEEDKPLSLDELDAVSGGDGHGKRDKNGTSCWCSFGGGNKGNNDGQCACVMYGQNEGFRCVIGGDFDFPL